MYKIGEFSNMSKITVKTLRYYEQEGLLLPSYIDSTTGYRYYEASQLVDVSKIVSLRQIGVSIKNIKDFLKGVSPKEILEERKQDIMELQDICNSQLLKINYLLEGENMNNEIVLKELPACTVYYKEGVIKEYADLTQFILQSGEECLKLNPGLKCIIPDYCFVSYLDGEYKEKNIKVRYSQAVEKAGIENESIKFTKLEPQTAACIYHKGAYEGLGKSYGIIMNYIEQNGYEVVDFPRECYIDGIWNKENEGEWLTEIQIPVKKK